MSPEVFSTQPAEADSEEMRGRQEGEAPSGGSGQGQLGLSSALCPSLTSMIRLSTGIVVLTMCTFGVEVERCLWDREPSEEGLDGLKVKA